MQDSKLSSLYALYGELVIKAELLQARINSVKQEIAKELSLTENKQLENKE